MPIIMVEMKEMGMTLGLLVVLTGPSRAGKDMTMKAILERWPQMQQLVTYTSRPQAANETDGVDYHFVSKEEFEQMQAGNKLLECVPYGRHWKGTSRGALEQVLGGGEVVWRIDMSRAAGVEELFKQMFDLATAEALLARTVVIAVVPDRVATLKRRWVAEGRGDDEEFRSRLRQDARVWRERRDRFDHVVVNLDEEQDRTVEQVAEIIEAKRAELTVSQS